MKEYQCSEREARNRAAARYETWYVETKGNWFDRREREIFARGVVRDSVVLDLGSGTGRITETMARRAALTVALDFSLDSLDRLSGKRLPRVTAVGGDAATGLPFQAGTFDVVVSCQVVQHLMSEDLHSAVRECRRVLKGGGRLYLAVYNLEYWRFRRVAEVMDADGQYYRRFDSRYLRDLARSTRFAVKRIDYYKTLPTRGFGTGHLPESLLIRLDQILCRIPMISRFTSAYFFAELEAQN